MPGIGRRRIGSRAHQHGGGGQISQFKHPHRLSSFVMSWASKRLPYIRIWLASS